MADEPVAAASCLQEDQSGLANPRALAPDEAAAAPRAATPPAPDTLARGARPQIHAFRQGRAVTAQARGPHDIRAIVIHTPEGGESGTLGVLNGTRASFDFFLPLNGRLYQCNDYWRYIAWQAGDWDYNVRSVGIEQGDFAARSGQFPEAHYRRLAQLVAYLIQTTATPLRYATAYGQDGIIDHATITPAERSDPGAGFRRDLLLRLVEEQLRQEGDDGADPVWTRGTLVAGPGALARLKPARESGVLQRLTAGQTYSTDGYTDRGEAVAGSARWYHLSRESGYGWVHASGGQYGG